MKLSKLSLIENLSIVIQIENGFLFCVDKTTDCFPSFYHLSFVNNTFPITLIEDFCEGKSWKDAIKFVENWLDTFDFPAKKENKNCSNSYDCEYCD